MTHPLLQKVGTKALDGVIEVGLGADLWSIQRKIARALSTPNARVVVPACFSSGKSFLGGALPLAFHMTFDPSKVIMTSSREDQLEDVLWAELRRHYSNLIIPLQGHLPPREMRYYPRNDHFIVGHSPARPEGLKGYHGPKILVVVDEGSHMPPDMGQAVLSLMSSGDARLLVLLNPTSADSWAANLTESSHVTTIPISAFDTPLLSHLTNEEIAERWGETSLPPTRLPTPESSPSGAALITPKHLDDMCSRGQGPGSYEWETGTMARFWSAGSNRLVPDTEYQAALARTGTHEGQPYSFGIDLASYGDSESVVAIRRGNVLLSFEARHKMQPEDFIRSVVGPLYQKFNPSMVVYDADGPGAGVARLMQETCGASAFGFRGQFKWGVQFLNTRSAWWWKLRNRFITGDIAISFTDATLQRQIFALTYDHTSAGLLKVLDKHSLHRKGISSIDRADAMMYAFAYDAPTSVREEIDNTPPEELWGRARKRARAVKSQQGYVVMPRGRVPLPRR